MARYYRPQQNIPAGSYDNTYSKLGTMEERMLVAETMIQAMWTLLKEEGVSTERFIDALDKTHKLRKEKTNASVDHFCPKCGKKMQVNTMAPFIVKCFYCNTEDRIDPFEKYYDKNEEEVPEENQTRQEFYDLLKDLNLDDK